MTQQILLLIKSIGGLFVSVHFISVSWLCPHTLNESANQGQVWEGKTQNAVLELAFFILVVL